jgi:hypothetical protein
MEGGVPVEDEGDDVVPEGAGNAFGRDDIEDGSGAAAML